MSAIISSSVIVSLFKPRNASFSLSTAEVSSILVCVKSKLIKLFDNYKDSLDVATELVYPNYL